MASEKYEVKAPEGSVFQDRIFSRKAELKSAPRRVSGFS